MSLKFHTVCFYCMSKSKTTKIYWSYGVKHLLLLHIKLFYKTKRSGTSVQGFMQAILISGRRHKKLNLLTEFWNSIFIIFFLKRIKTKWLRACIQNKSACYVLFCFKLFPPGIKRFLPLYPPLRLCTCRKAYSASRPPPLFVGWFCDRIYLEI